MNRLQSERQRLYFCDEPGRVRAAVLQLAAPADWEALGPLWRGVQSDLGLPAPGIAVTGRDGFQLWFSFAHSLPRASAQAWLEGLRQRYLPQIAPPRLKLWTGAGAELADFLPPRQEQSGQWSALIAPDLAPIFADEPWLDTPPNEEGQADLLHGLQSIEPEALNSALAQLGLSAEPQTMVTELPDASRLGTAEAQAQQFLLRVMHDESQAMALRMEAALALLRRPDALS